MRTLQWLDAAGNSESLSADSASYMFPRLSPDGNRLVLRVTQGSSTDDLWSYDLQRGGKTRLTSGTGLNSWPVWSPDGQDVIFQSTGGMFWARADGAGKPRSLTQSKKLQFPSSFSPNGKWLTFTELTSGTASEIRTLRVESIAGQLRTGESKPFLKGSTTNSYAVFSPDGRWLAYTDPPAGTYEVYVRAFPDNGSQVQISDTGGTSPVWSRNGDPQSCSRAICCCPPLILQASPECEVLPDLE